MSKRVIIIGAGFGGIGAAALLAKAGWTVTVLEKNEQLGGRASMFSVGQDQDGVWKNLEHIEGLHDQELTNPHGPERFRFDMGPSWYLMPDVFEHFFKLLGEDVHEHLRLQKLMPSYRIFYKDAGRQVDIYSDLTKDLPTFESIEQGSADKLEQYLEKAGYQYAIAKDRFMYKNYDSVRDFFTKEMIVEGSKLNALSTMNRYVGKYFKTHFIQKIMQYPLVFLGSSPYNAPAIYNIMSHVDFNMGVFYPQGGLNELTQSLVSIAQQHGTEFITNTPVEQIIVKDNQAVGVTTASGQRFSADLVISNADMNFTENQLLSARHQSKTKKYWDKRTLAPSALLLYLGVKGKLPTLTHHNLVFSQDWAENFQQIFDQPQWPDDPSLYVCNPSKTDPSVAPAGHENLFVLVPVAPGLDYTEDFLQSYTQKILQTIETTMDIPDLRERIVYQETFSIQNFLQRFNSTQGTALGLAHTLKQTAAFRPNNVSAKVSNMMYVGADTNPGIGMPTTLISAELCFKRIIKDASSGPLRPDQVTSQ